jgi:hypothetical protein
VVHLKLVKQYNGALDIPVVQWPHHHQTLFDTREWAIASRWPTDPTQYVMFGEALLPFRLVQNRDTWINADANALAGGYKYLSQGTLEEDERIYPHVITMGPGYYTESGGSEADTQHLVEHLEHLSHHPIMFAYVYPGGTLSRVLERRNYVSGMISASAWLPLPGKHFNDYLDMLNANRRRSVRRELAAFNRTGVTVTTYVGKASTAHLSTFACLSNAVQRHHGNNPDPNDTLHQLHQFVDLFGDRVIFFFGRANGKTIAATMAVICHGMIFARDIGLEYDERSRDAMVYFNMAYYEVIRYAYDNGLKIVCAGISTFKAKALRGFQLIPLLAYVPRGTSWEKSLVLTDRALRANVGPWLVSKPFPLTCQTSQ